MRPLGNLSHFPANLRQMASLRWSTTLLTKSCNFLHTPSTEGRPSRCRHLLQDKSTSSLYTRSRQAGPGFSAGSPGNPRVLTAGRARRLKGGYGGPISGKRGLIGGASRRSGRHLCHSPLQSKNDIHHSRSPQILQKTARMMFALMRRHTGRANDSSPRRGPGRAGMKRRDVPVGPGVLGFRIPVVPGGWDFASR